MTTRQQQAIEAVKSITEAGWTFEWYSSRPGATFCGWWRLLNSDTSIKSMRRGDPKPFYEGALVVKELYF